MSGRSFSRREKASEVYGISGYSTTHQQTIIIAQSNNSSYMSFFSIEQRDILRPVSQNPLGPGKYDPSNAHPHRKHAAYAPFGSLSSKKAASSEGGLGPGQYNISSPIIRPSITKYENKNIIIVKVNDEGGHQFKSRTNRFRQPLLSAVGPGSYDPQSLSPPRMRSSSLHPRSKVTDKVRAINRQFCEERKPTLLSDPPLCEAREGRATRSESGGKGVVRWGLNRKERFEMLVREPFDENDKRKALSEFSSASRKKKVRPSAVFASKSIKSHLETQIYKTNNSFKAQLRKMIDYKDEQPGPGSYDPPVPSGPRVHPRFQFFGSTVERFPPQEEQAVGPGLYEVTSKGQRTQPRETVGLSEDRHSYLAKNFTPGPGAYEVERPILESSFSDKGLEAGFGSVQARFNYKEKKTQETMDEGSIAMKSYFKEKQAKRQEEIKLLKRITEDHPSAVFTSQTKRFEEGPAQAVEVGSYDITHYDITAKVARHQKLIQQLEECQLHKPPFLSSDPRFKTPVPQSHPNEHRNCWCQVKSVEKQMIDHESPVFLSNDHRTTFEQPYKAPPVGYYQQPDRSLIKDSFNSRFRKKQQNTAKKEAARARQLQHRLQTHPSHPQPLALSPPH